MLMASHSFSFSFSIHISSHVVLLAALGPLLKKLSSWSINDIDIDEHIKRISIRYTFLHEKVVQITFIS